MNHALYIIRSQTGKVRLPDGSTENVPLLSYAGEEVGAAKARGWIESAARRWVSGPPPYIVLHDFREGSAVLKWHGGLSTAGESLPGTPVGLLDRQQAWRCVLPSRDWASTRDTIPSMFCAVRKFLAPVVKARILETDLELWDAFQTAVLFGRPIARLTPKQILMGTGSALQVLAAFSPVTLGVPWDRTLHETLVEVQNLLVHQGVVPLKNPCPVCSGRHLIARQEGAAEPEPLKAGWSRVGFAGEDVSYTVFPCEACGSRLQDLL
jgi:hypothetical protein